jgi:hypothetical protein
MLWAAKLTPESPYSAYPCCSRLPGRENMDRDHSRGILGRLSVAEAAEALDFTHSTLRKPVQRDQISWEKDENGKLWVCLGPSEARRGTSQDSSRDTLHPGERDAFIESLQDQIAFLRTELECKDVILMTMAAQRIPELEPASEPRESSKRATEDDGRGEEGCSGARTNGRPPGWSYRLLSGKSKGKVEREDEWLLRLPVPVVLVILWIAGAALMGLCVLVLYSYG